MGNFIELDALFSVIVVGIVVGAGIPAIFAAGIWAISAKEPVKVDGAATSTPVAQPISVWRKLLATICFTVCIASVVAGVYFIASGGH